jgi:hypothetical protein
LKLEEGASEIELEDDDPLMETADTEINATDIITRIVAVKRKIFLLGLYISVERKWQLH